MEIKEWDESIKSKIDSVTSRLYIDENGFEELYFDVCFKELKEFTGEKQLRKKIENILKTKKVQFYYSLPF